MATVHSSHTLVHIAIEAPDAKTLPVLVELDDPERPRISPSVAQFARYLQKQGNCSYEKIRKAVSAIGKLRDYYLLVRLGQPVPKGGLKNLLEGFLFAVDHGNVLDWRPTSLSTYSIIRSSVADYVKFLTDNSEIEWESSDREFVDACRKAMVAASHAEKSLLFHTKKLSRKKRAGRKKSVFGLKLYKPFPPHLVTALIENTPNVRDKLFFGMLAYGGRRVSELLHLFLTDVGAVNNAISVVLLHPVHAPMAWRSHHGKNMKGERREYLKTEFDLLPRTEHGAQPSAVGWKGMKFDDMDSMTSRMYFIRNVERYLLALHQTYLHSIRTKNRGARHPYYFVAADGSPLTIKALEKQFSLACRRLERKYGVSLKGYGPHSLRHFFGFYCADVLGADLLMIQKWMGHVDPSSTAIYAHISPESAAEALAEAELNAAMEGRIRISEVERAEIMAQFRRAEMDPIPESWRGDGTAFGHLDISKLSRRMK